MKDHSEWFLTPRPPLKIDKQTREVEKQEK